MGLAALATRGEVMGFEAWVNPHLEKPDEDQERSSRRGRSSPILERGIPRSLAEPATGVGRCTRCGEEKLLDQDGMIMWHPSEEDHRQRYNDEGDRQRGCLG